MVPPRLRLTPSWQGDRGHDPPCPIPPSTGSQPKGCEGVTLTDRVTPLWGHPGPKFTPYEPFGSSFGGKCGWFTADLKFGDLRLKWLACSCSSLQK